MREKHHDTKLFTTEGSINFVFCFLCKFGSNGYKVKLKRENYDKNVYLTADRAL